MKHYNIYFLFLFFFAVQTAAAQDWKNEKYIDIEVLGWKVKVNTRLLEGDTSVLKKSLGLFGKELYDISQVLPSKSLKVLKTVTFWFEKETTTHGYTGEYWSSTSQKYLFRHGADPLKAGGIEIVAGRYIDQKAVMNDWVILHELAHAYHNLVIQYDEQIQKTFKVIFNANLYADVRKGLDKLHHGYARTNYAEYFAEITTKYFGHSYYYPNDRADLKHYDILGYKLVEKLWRVNEK